MPRERISFTNFDRRLWLAGGREQAPPGALRRARGVAPESTGSIRSRAGSTLLYPGIAAISVYRYNGHRYAYDGIALYQDGVSIKTGFTGGPLTFVTMPPQVGLPDYLFILGGGVAPFKISPTGTISNWGILPPKDAMQGLPGAPDSLIIDSFVAHAGSWTGVNCTLSNATVTPPFGGAASCLNVAPTNGQDRTWSFHQTYGSPLNLAYYADGRPSLITDLISFHLWVSDATKLLYLVLEFDLLDATFKQMFRANIQILPGSANKSLAGGIDAVAQVDGGRWALIGVPKSAFQRVPIPGSTTAAQMNLDWNTVKAIRIMGGLAYGGVGAVALNFQDLQLTGGYALGTGPAAFTGGSTYLGQVTFGNDMTGSDSNPNLQPAVVEGVAEGPIVWRNIPVSPDPQVTNRKLWRSVALPLGATAGNLFYVDTIHDNTTTTYKDVFGDTSTPFTNTIWTASATYILNQLIDGGNGWLFKATTAGTSGATNPPWNAPGGYWIGLFSGFNLNDQIYDPASGFIFKLTQGGQTGRNIPYFASVTLVGGTIQDGGAQWTRVAAPTTADGSIVWTFAGQNSAPVLGNQEVLLDNTAPSSTFGDAAGPWQGSMVWTRDSAFPGAVYFSPPGRPESVGVQLNVTGTTDSAQKVVVWDIGLWLLSTQRVFPIVGAYPEIGAPSSLGDSAGTNAPYTVVAVRKIGVIYAATDGIRRFNFGGTDLIGFANIAPLLVGTGDGAEDYGPFNPTIAFETPSGEVVFTDPASGQSLALSFEQGGGEPSWREPGPVLTAGYFERDTGSVLASWGGNVYLFEEIDGPDGPNPISFEMQSPGAMPDVATQFTTQRLYITVQLNGQNLTPTLIVDGTSYVLPKLVGTTRRTFELPYQIGGRLFDGVNLTGNLTGRIEVFRIEADVWYGEVSAAAGR